MAWLAKHKHLYAQGKINARERRFHASYAKQSNGCWLWTKGLDGYGYGKIDWRPFYTAHRWSYAHFVAPIPAGLWVLHRCDNPACVNPAHLFLGTVLINNQDAMHKGRTAKGAKHPRFLLTDATRYSIALLRERYRMSQDEIARALGIGQTTVSRSLAGRVPG